MTRKWIKKIVKRFRVIYKCRVINSKTAAFWESATGQRSAAVLWLLARL